MIASFMAGFLMAVFSARIGAVSRIIVADLIRQEKQVDPAISHKDFWLSDEQA